MKNVGLLDLLVRLRFSRYFEAFVVAVILVGAVSAGLKTFPFASNFEWVFASLDVGITIIFCVELALRFVATDKPRARSFFKDGWNLFDSLIVAISLVPLNNGELVLVARILRVFRLMRLISFIPELRLLVNSFISVIPKLGYLCLLIFILFYLYATVGATVFSSINPELWGDVSLSMLTLFRVMTLEAWTDVMYETMEVYPWSWAYFVSFIVLTAFAFLNMLIGIVVKVIEEESLKIDEGAKLAEEQRKQLLEGLGIVQEELKSFRDQLEQRK